MLLSICEVKAGMKLEQAVVSPDNGQCLLNAGVAISNSNIEKFRELGIQELSVADRFSVFISPEDKMAENLVKDFIKVLRTICPNDPEGNMNDNVVRVAKSLEGIISKIARFNDIMPLLFEMKITNNTYLYKHSIYTSVLSGIVAECMNLTLEEVVYIVTGALLHNIGMCEMPILIEQENLTGQQLELYHQHPTYGYYLQFRRIFHVRLQNVFNTIMRNGMALDIRKDCQEIIFRCLPG